ncbi:hypothetical protein AB0M44_04395 [Streptosporangium subroseum]|uniref:hypothetical protein n=1 Tax=Streptosporangium subroseum TaxID=106412 RepID=UPI003419EE77
MGHLQPGHVARTVLAEVRQPLEILLVQILARRQLEVGDLVRTSACLAWFTGSCR